MSLPKITLDQWAALQAIVDCGSFAAAAQRLHKSQSTLTYAIQQLERSAGVAVFSLQGRKAALTPAGEILYRQGRRLVEEARRIERLALDLAAGHDAQIVLAVEMIFPVALLLDALARFAQEYPKTRVELFETVLGGTSEALLDGRIDFAIAPAVPQGFLGDFLMRVRFIAAAHPGHPLHQLGRRLTLEDLQAHRHLVVRESGTRRAAPLSIAADARWTVSHRETAVRAARMGLGFAWFPEENIRDALHEGSLKALPLVEGGERFSDLYLIFTDPDGAGPCKRRMVEILRTAVAHERGEAAAAPR